MSDRRRRILFVAEAVTLAHVARPLVLARSLPPDRYDIHFACAPGHEFFLKGSSFTHHTIHSISSERFLAALAHGWRLYDEKTLADYVEEDRRLLDHVRPDLVIGDFRLSLAVSAPLGKVPYAALANAHWSPYTTRRHFPLPELPLTRFLSVPLTRTLFHVLQPLIFHHHARPLNRLRRRHGLTPLGNLLHVYTHGDYTLYADLPSLLSTVALPPNHHYLGAIVWSPPLELPSWWHSIEADRPILYVTLGSSGQIDLLPVVVEALGELPVTAVIATAGRFQLSAPPDNVRIARYLPGSEAARRSALVICNGGSATVYQALAEGVPVLGIASNMDQHLTMSALQAAGAGLLLRAGQVRRESFSRAVSDLLHSESYRRSAKLLADQCREYDVPARFRDFVESTVG